MSETKAPLGTLSARLEERILQPLRGNAFARRTWFSVTVAIILALYGGLLGWMLWRDAADPPHGAEAQETPVEVVAEMPKVPPQPPAPKQEAEKPASSAPRAFNDATDEAHDDKDTHAPKTPTPAAKAAPEPSKEEAKEPDKADPAEDTPDKADKPEEKAEAPKPPDAPDKEAEALDRAPPVPPKRPAKLAKAAPKPPHRPKSALQQLAGDSELPDYTFAKPMRKHAKVSGGTEDDRYLAVVYGLIMQSQRPIRVPYGDWTVSVSFVVDGGGNLMGVQVSRSSGYPEVDAQAIEAVESAAPYPPPPSGGTTGLVARLRSMGGPTAYGDR